MCSQPPREVDDSEATSDLLRIISLVSDAPEHMGITGGEPTLLGDGLIEVVAALRDRLPGTAVTMLTNGRMFCYESYVKKLAAVGHARCVSSIPLYADNAQDHDFVVQVSGAFDQTQRGLYNAALHGLAVELRVVLHKHTTPRLVRLVDFIYRNLPFVQHVALMGMENTGYARANDEEVWVDPVDYVGDLEEAVRQLHYRRVAVSIYNLPLCILPADLWSFARQSISDYKNIYLDECAGCRERTRCAGLFESSRKKHSRGIRAIA
jgi:His-Xaa-Ser system radical SAM maturase HxsC